jgi:WD40 repeat protein
LTREQVLRLVAGGVPSERAAALVNQRGLDFKPTEEYLETLRIAGAGEVLLKSLREAKPVSLFELAATLAGHTERILTLAFSSDGKYLASGSWDKTIKVWAVKAEQEVCTLDGHAGAVACLAFSPDGRLLASGYTENVIKIWEVGTGREVRTLTAHAHPVSSVAFSPDGGILFSGSYDGTLRRWNVNLDWAGGGPITRLKDIFFMGLSPEGRYLAFGTSADHLIRLWDAASLTEICSITGHSSVVKSVAFSRHGKYLASGSHDRTVRLWELPSGRELRALTGHTDSVDAVAFSPDGQYVASGSEDKTLRLWEVPTGRELATLREHSNSVIDVVFSPDGKYLASGSADKTVKLWRRQD